MTQLSPRKNVLVALLLPAVFAGMADCQSNEYAGDKLDWFEDFRTGLTDKGLRWAIASPAQIHRVAKGSGTCTWPTQLTHVAQNIYEAEHAAAYEAINLWPDPEVGQYLFLRMLLCNVLPNGASTGGDHGFQTNFNAPIPWFWRVWGGDADSFQLDAATWDEANTAAEMQIEVPKHTVLRLEWRVQRTGTSSAVLTVRVYNNQTGALLGEDAFTQTTPAGGGANPFREYKFGMSGQGGASYNGGSVYWGALAARVSSNANDWIGPYPVPGVER